MKHAETATVATNQLYGTWITPPIHSQLGKPNNTNLIEQFMARKQQQEQEISMNHSTIKGKNSNAE